MPIVRSLGGKRQDGSFEGALLVFMVHHYFVAILHHYLCCTDSDSILQPNLFITLSCVEVISELRVASIFFVAFIFPMHCLAGKTRELSHKDWGERSMPRALDLMYNTFIEIQANGDKFLNEDFIMKIFDPLYTDLPELETYLTFYFGEEEANVVGSCKLDDRVLAIDGTVGDIF